jgi:hypothetical protein
VREIRTLRAKWRGLETESRTTLPGHKGGNPGYRQGESYGLPRQSSTLPGVGEGGFVQRNFSKWKSFCKNTTIVVGSFSRP